MTGPRDFLSPVRTAPGDFRDQRLRLLRTVLSPHELMRTQDPASGLTMFRNPGEPKFLPMDKLMLDQISRAVEQIFFRPVNNVDNFFGGRKNRFVFHDLTRQSLFFLYQRFGRWPVDQMIFIFFRWNIIARNHPAPHTDTRLMNGFGIT